jgi:replicative DNA helicase
MEKTILSHLALNEKFTRKALPYLNDALFYERDEKILFSLISEYVEKYNTIPTKETLFIDLGLLETLSDSDYTETKASIRDLNIEESTKLEWLMEKTENFVQDRSIQNAIRKSIGILDQDSDLTRSAIPGLLQEALQVSFDTKVGHDFLDGAEERFDNYHAEVSKLRFNVDYFNRITGGGIPDKTLTCIMAPPGVGKSMAMCSFAAGNLMDQKNVLYITLEMAEERIAERIDANLLDVTLTDLMALTKAQYTSKIDSLKRSTKGKLIIKEYPTASAGAGHFRHLLSELKLKKNFRPDVIYIDYINLCTSSRIKASAGVNSYTYIKAIAEELRGLAVEQVLPIITATQSNRASMGADDIDMNNTSDSIGLPQTADFMVALIATDELDDMGQLMVKQLKNRFGDVSTSRRFVVGVNKAKMRLFDVEQAQDEDDKPVMDNTQFGQQETERNSKRLSKAKIEGFT